MDRPAALRTLNLTDDEGIEALQAVYEQRKSGLQDQLKKGLDETLRIRCQRALVNLEEAYVTLRILPGAQVAPQTLTPLPLSATMMRDLPGATPFYTQDGTGGSGAGGMRVGIV